MAITFNPQVKFSNKPSFRENEVKSQSAQTPKETPSVPQAKPRKTFKGFLANVAYAWVNLAESTKGIVNGLIAAGITGTLIAGVDTVVSGVNKKMFLQGLKHPKQVMGVFGKVVAPVVAVIVLAGNLISARLRANQRTANVDHALYEGHRDK